MDALTVLTVRNTFLELLVVGGGDARQRKARSEGPQTGNSSSPRRALIQRPHSIALGSEAASSNANEDCRAHHLIFPAGASDSLEVSGVEPSFCPTPWSSQCGDWGYQDDVLAGFTFDLQMGTAFMETSWVVCVQPGLEESANTVTPWSSACGDWDDWEIPPAFDEGPGTNTAWAPWVERSSVVGAAPTDKAMEDRSGQLAKTSPLKCGSYLEALMGSTCAPQQPRGKSASPQTASRPHVEHRAAGVQTALSSNASLPASAVNREGAAEPTRVTKAVGKGRRRSGKLSGCRRRVPVEVLPA